jgi:glycosyltransferase involved in cell wall biosynthesis
MTATANGNVPRVLHLLACDNWGGTEIQISTQVKVMDPGAARQAVAILQPPGVVHERLTRMGAQVWSLAGPGGMAGAAVRLARILRSERFDILECFGFQAGLVARAARLADRRSKLVVGVRGLHFTESEDPNGFKTRLVIAIERAMQRTVTLYDANSAGAREFLASKGFDRERFVVIPNGVDADVPVARLDGGGSRLICVARFVARKRHDVLLQALARVRETVPDLQCEMVGYGPTMESAQALAGELGLAGAVEFVGRQSHAEIRERLAAADIFVLTSMSEGMPGSVMEAMAAGLPVVASDVNGTNEVVRHDRTGLLVAPGDAEATADALRRLLADPQLRRSMGETGRRTVLEEYSFARVAAGKARLYASL